jgi:hypothetical protein
LNAETGLESLADLVEVDQPVPASDTELDQRYGSDSDCFRKVPAVEGSP